MSFEVNFLKAVERNWKKNIFQGQVGMISEKLKKFGVHRYSAQSTEDDQHPPFQVGLSINALTL